MKKFKSIFGIMIFTTALAINTKIHGQSVHIPICPTQQEWMDKNLDISSLNDGTPILQAKTNAQWIAACNSKTPAWCFYNNNPSNELKYGKLYNWFAVATGKLTPIGVGWHVPSYTEFNTLITNLGGYCESGGKLKSINEWSPPNTGASNSSGFAALPGGDRRDNGIFENIGGRGGWWSTTTNSLKPTYVSNLYLAWSVATAYITENTKCFGFSVRCVR